MEYFYGQGLWLSQNLVYAKGSRPCSTAVNKLLIALVVDSDEKKTLFFNASQLHHHWVYCEFVVVVFLLHHPVVNILKELTENHPHSRITFLI